jgi:hypothetical protein
MTRLFGAALVVVVCCLSLRAQDDLAPAVTNAVLEGVQVSSEPGTKPSEKIVSCYFIFRDKPSSYFYEFNKKDKKLVFEFNDVKKGVSPIESSAETPILGFTAEEKKVDINRAVSGMNPEWHDVTVVSLTLQAIPIITVNEEYSVISFSFKWCTDPNKCDQYVEKNKSKKWWWIGGLGGAGLVGGGVVVAVLLSQPPPEPGPSQIDISDLPTHRK